MDILQKREAESVGVGKEMEETFSMPVVGSDMAVHVELLVECHSIFLSCWLVQGE